ncbi:Bro-N domain-containing protein, partial [Escherichia coli]|nr:Bro-N domain-containing protein [Escherichia coli]
MNTKPSVFSFESNCNVRAIMVDGNPWFVATDVCNAIGIKHAASAMRALDGEEKGVHSMHTPGGHQDFTIINESGLYTLILRCRDAV